MSPGGASISSRLSANSRWRVHGVAFAMTSSSSSSISSLEPVEHREVAVDDRVGETRTAGSRAPFEQRADAVRSAAQSGADRNPSVVVDGQQEAACPRTKSTSDRGPRPRSAARTGRCGRSPSTSSIFARWFARRCPRRSAGGAPASRRSRRPRRAPAARGRARRRPRPGPPARRDGRRRSFDVSRLPSTSRTAIRMDVTMTRSGRHGSRQSARVGSPSSGASRSPPRPPARVDRPLVRLAPASIRGRRPSASAGGDRDDVSAGGHDERCRP